MYLKLPIERANCVPNNVDLEGSKHILLKLLGLKEKDKKPFG
jgi:hypothetical protein